MTKSGEDDETMKLKNTLIVVKNIEKAKQFYYDLFGLEMLRDNDGNMILTDGLVLQEERYWKEFLKREIIPQSNLETLYPDIQYVNRLMTHSWGQTVIRFYDLDGNLIEVGTPV